MNIEGRVWRRKSNATPGFTARYKASNLVWFEETASIEAAILREKQIKPWRRKWKIALIKSANPNWRDLSKEWTDIRRF